MTLEELLFAYLSANAAIRSIATGRLLGFTVKHFGEFLNRTALVGDLTDTNLVSFMRYRRQLGRAETTVENEGVKLLALWRWAAIRSMVAPPSVRIERRRPDAPHALIKPQIRALFKAARRAMGMIGGKPRCVYFPALLGIVWDTGERISAVRALRRIDIDLRMRCVTFRVRKGHGRTLTKPISRSTARALKHWLAIHDADEPFAIVGLTSVYYHLDRILVAAGIPPESRNKFHALRRSHASYLHAAGGDATESLDHSDARVTRMYYLDPRIIMRRRAIDRLFNPFGFWQSVLAWLGW